MAQNFTHGELVSSPTEMTPADRDRLPPPVVKHSHTDISPLPVAPCKLARYERADNQYDSALCAQARRLTPPHDGFSVPVADHPIKPMMFCKPSEDQPDYSPQLWKRFIHPEGQVYYHSDDLQLVTDADATREDVHQAIMGTCKELRRQMNQLLAHQRPDSETEELLWHHHHENWELCVEVVFDTDNLIIGISYYIADWNRRCVMWLEEGLSGKAVGLEHHACDEHLRQDLEGQFWKHVEYFSAHRPLPPGAYEELKGILVYAGTDRMTSTDSTASFNATDIRSFLQLLQVECGDGPGQRYFTATVARHWHEACDNRVHHLYGLPGARLCRSQSRYYAPLATDNPGLFMRTVASVFLFNDPVRIYQKLCATYVDRSVCIDHWRTFLKGVQEDWRSNSVIATVMLAANMGFLAIGQLGGTGSVKTSGDVNADPSAQMPLPAQTLSAISALLSIGSIISGMLLVRRHRELDTPYCTADQAGEYMSECARQFYGLFGAAMHFSTPFALQLWCLILFVGAMLTYSFFTPSFIISPFIAFTVVSLLVVFAAQIWFFWQATTFKPQGSTWTAPPASGEKSRRTCAVPPMPSFSSLVSTSWIRTASKSLAPPSQQYTNATDSRNETATSSHPPQSQFHRLSSVSSRVTVPVERHSLASDVTSPTLPSPPPTFSRGGRQRWAQQRKRGSISAVVPLLPVANAGRRASTNDATSVGGP